jgi:hypothetical protein
MLGHDASDLEHPLIKGIKACKNLKLEEITMLRV